MTFARRFFIVAAVLSGLACMAPSAFAQGGITVSLSLKDSSTGEPVGFATVSLSKEGASSPSNYALSNSEGKVSIAKVRRGKYVLKAEMMGYIAYTKQVEITKSVDFGEIKLDPDQEQLDAAKVSAAGNPVIIKKDTVEYNASSFKISDNDMLENLLKKLPGLEVAEDGSITANGETITKITIDGKTFFLDDPQLASKNIPAKIVEKVKVVKKKSEQAEFTGISDGEEETVIDLSVQKNMMNGIFGNAMAGGGVDIPQAGVGGGDFRYQSSLMAGRFSDDSQISVIANGNNTNNRGFNDMAGSMMSSMRGGGGGMGRGAGGMGGSGNGVTTSWMAGVNGSFDLFDDKMELGGNYLYNGTHSAIEEDSYKETYLDNGSALISDNSGSSTSNTSGHRFGLQLEHKFSDNTSILFRPQFNFGHGDYLEISDFSTLTEDAAGQIDSTNRGFTSTSGDSRSFRTNGLFLFRQRLGMPGRTISFNLNWNLSKTSLDGLNQSETYTYRTATDSLINQRVDQTSDASSITGRLVYTEPLGNDFYFEGSYSLGWNKNVSEKLTYDSGDGYGISGHAMTYVEAGERLNETYTNSILNRYINQNIGVALMYQAKGLTGQIGLTANPTDTKNETNGDTYKSKVLNWAPRAMLFYDFTENANIRMFYNGRSSQPSTSQLMPVMDNSNPLQLSLGNPYLRPYFNHSMRMELGYSDKETFLTVRAFLDGSLTTNPIVSAVWYDNGGVQYSFPVNGANSMNASARLMLNTPIARSDFSVMNNMNVSYSKSGSYIGSSQLDMSGYFSDDHEFDYEGFHEDYGDLGSSKDFTDNITRSLSVTERLRLTYRSDNLEITAGGRTRFSKPWYTVANYASNTTWNNQVSGSVYWTLGDSGFETSADLNYNWYRGYSTPQESQMILNASLSKLLFNKQATLSLKAYDILDRARNLSVTDATNYHQEIRNNTLGRYIILSLTWRFGNFGNARQQINSRFGGRGPGGPPPGGRRPEA